MNEISMFVRTPKYAFIEKDGRARVSKGNPVGCFVARKEFDEQNGKDVIIFGYSFVHECDVFKKKLGKKIASGRANFDFNDEFYVVHKISPKYRNKFKKFVERAHKYFQI